MPTTRLARQVRSRFERVTGESADSWAALQNLVDEQVPEGPDLDYKLRAYDDPRKTKEERNDELRKDVTAMANSLGGVIVCGVSDSNGLPGAVLGFTENLDRLEGTLGSVIRSRIQPPIDGVEIVGVVEPGGTGRGCMLIIVPGSSRAPHAVQPHADQEALKYARRVGRHTEWLSETQVADLYRARFTAAVDQSDRAGAVLDALRRRLRGRQWLLLALVPDSPGEFTVTPERLTEAEAWWDTRRMLGLLPYSDNGVATASAGARRVVLARSDGQTSVPAGVYLELHDDGTCGVALELKDAPSGNPSFFVDDLVTQTLDAVTWAADFSIRLAVAAGYALLCAALHFPKNPQAQLVAFDPSWVDRPQPLPHGVDETVHTTHTVDAEAIQLDPRETVAAAGVVAGQLIQFFGLPDSRYLTSAGVIRVDEYRADMRDRLVIPKASELGVPFYRAGT